MVVFLAVVVVAFQGKLFIKRVKFTIFDLIKVPSNWRMEMMPSDGMKFCNHLNHMSIHQEVILDLILEQNGRNPVMFSSKNLPGLSLLSGSRLRL